jgi:replicative superfamily II helicase
MLILIYGHSSIQHSFLGKWTELSPLDILQMMEKAGRFDLDSEDEDIILTGHLELQH